MSKHVQLSVTTPYPLEAHLLWDTPQWNVGYKEILPIKHLVLSLPLIQETFVAMAVLPAWPMSGGQDKMYADPYLLGWWVA